MQLKNAVSQPFITQTGACIVEEDPEEAKRLGGAKISRQMVYEAVISNPLNLKVRAPPPSNAHTCVRGGKKLNSVYTAADMAWRLRSEFPV